jgi:hypothetical protein
VKKLAPRLLSSIAASLQLILLTIHLHTLPVPRTASCVVSAAAVNVIVFDAFDLCCSDPTDSGRSPICEQEGDGRGWKRN